MIRFFLTFKVTKLVLQIWISEFFLQLLHVLVITINFFFKFDNKIKKIQYIFIFFIIIAMRNN